MDSAEPQSAATELQNRGQLLQSRSQLLQTCTSPGWHMLTPGSVAHSGRASGTIPLPQIHVPAHYTPSPGTLHSILKCTFLAWCTTTTLRLANYQQGRAYPSEAGQTLGNTRECLFRHSIHNSNMSVRPVVVKGAFSHLHYPHTAQSYQKQPTYRPTPAKPSSLNSATMAEATATPICSPASPAIDPTQTQTVESTLQELAGLDQEVPYLIPRLAASLSSRFYRAFDPLKPCGIPPPD